MFQLLCAVKTCEVLILLLYLYRRRLQRVEPAPHSVYAREIQLLGKTLQIDGSRVRVERRRRNVHVQVNVHAQHSGVHVYVHVRAHVCACIRAPY